MSALLDICFELVSCLAYSFSMKMEATCSSVTSVDFQWTTRYDISEDRTLHNHCCENLKSYTVIHYGEVYLSQCLTIWEATDQEDQTPLYPILPSQVQGQEHHSMLLKLSLLPASCWFLAWLIFWPWRWRRHVHPKRRLIFNGLHGITFQKTELINNIFDWYSGFWFTFQGLNQLCQPVTFRLVA
jgi:hypothetical protein